jgi:GDP-L-fucose synthase
MKEEYLLTGLLEPTNEPYAIAKIAGIKMCEAYNQQYGTNFISVMPTNLYGPNDNFNLETSHVLPALMNKIHQGKQLGLKEVEVWGSGNPMREFMWSEDMADACVYMMLNPSEYSFVNIGTGKEISIRDLAYLIKKIVGFQGELVFNTSKPDGALRKVTDVSRLHELGWQHTVELEEGLNRLYIWYFQSIASIGSTLA